MQDNALKSKTPHGRLLGRRGGDGVEQAVTQDVEQRVKQSTNAVKEQRQAHGIARTGLRMVAAVLLSFLLAPGLLAQSDDGATGPGSGTGDAAASQESEETGPSIPQQLQQAYQREFVFLDNEIRLLRRRLERVEEDGERRVGNSRDELERLEARLLEVTAEVDRSEEELRLIEEERTETRNASDTVTSIVNQATSRLQNFGVSPYSETEQAQAAADASQADRQLEELSYVFFQSIGLLDELGSIREEQGTFFLADGTEVEGELIHIGRIASFGMGQDGSGGTLVPAGGGRLRLAEEETRPVAQQLATGGQPGTLPIFLYESLDNSAETRSGQSLADTIEGGGIIGIVILSIGGVAVLLIILRIINLVRVSRKNDKLLDAVVARVKEGDLGEALNQAATLPAAMGRVIRSTLQGLRSDPSSVEDVISESVLNEQPLLERYRSALSVFAAVAPLLGLLGTVTGMISTFDVITQYGTGDPQLLSGGISEALITTELGLAVAIPTLLIGNLLASWADRITSNLEVSALRIVNVHGGFEGAASMAG